MDQISTTRLAQVHPVVAQRVFRLEAALGFSLRVTQGLRNDKEQLALYSQGRFSLDVVNSRRSDVQWAPITGMENVKTVTNAGPGDSWHEYGVCVDVVPMDPVPDWNETHPNWIAIVTKARDFKLLDGISFHDAPHLQAIELSISPTPRFKQLLKDSGIQGVWLQSGIVDE